jgi:hypothetical protein
MKQTTEFHLVPKTIKTGVVSPLLHTSSWYDALSTGVTPSLDEYTSHRENTDNYYA